MRGRSLLPLLSFALVALLGATCESARLPTWSTISNRIVNVFKHCDRVLGKDHYRPEDINEAVQIVEGSLKEFHQKMFESRKRVYRFQHALSHGCVHATFSVNNDVPAEYKIGLFSVPKDFKAWIRFSNSGDDPDSADRVTLKGLAMKVLLGNELADQPRYLGPDDLNYLKTNQLNTYEKEQHFIFAGATPTFTVSSSIAASLGITLVAKTKNAGSLPSRIIRTLRAEPVSLVNALHSLIIPKSHHPFFIEWYSLSPYSLGDQKATKYILKPCSHTRKTFKPDRKDRHYFSTRLRTFLKEQDACFEFYIQPQVDACLQPVDEDTVAWDSKAILVGRITIPRQEVSADDQACENRVFNPGFSLKAHGPLGEINLTRVRAYFRSAHSRLTLNQQKEHVDEQVNPASR